jgi:hypothetical protein
MVISANVARVNVERNSSASSILHETRTWNGTRRWRFFITNGRKTLLICTQPLPSILALYKAVGQSSGGTERLDWFDDVGVGYVVELTAKKKDCQNNY